MKTLFLSLQKSPFEVMITGEKVKEYRKPSKWILSRLVNKTYDNAKFVNGYGNDKPYFIAEYINYEFANDNYILTYSNGLIVNVEIGDVIINLGKIIDVGNIK